MKKILFITVLFSSLLLSSCGDDLENLLDVSFNTSISQNIAVNVVGGNNSLNQTIPFSLANTDTSKYLDKLKTLEIKKMTYKIIEFSGDPTGKITVDLQADGETLHSITDKTVNTEFVNATVFEVTNKVALLNAATSLLKNKTISLKTTGQTITTEAMNFKILVTLDLAVVANPL